MIPRAVERLSDDDHSVDLDAIDRVRAVVSDSPGDADRSVDGSDAHEVVGLLDRLDTTREAWLQKKLAVRSEYADAGSLETLSITTKHPAGPMLLTGEHPFRSDDQSDDQSDD